MAMRRIMVRSFVSHLVGNRASFLCTKAPMLRIEHSRSAILKFESYQAALSSL